MSPLTATMLAICAAVRLGKRKVPPPVTRTETLADKSRFVAELRVGVPAPDPTKLLAVTLPHALNAVVSIPPVVNTATLLVPAIEMLALPFSVPMLASDVPLNTLVVNIPLAKATLPKK